MLGKKHLAAAILVTFCLTAMLFMILPSRSQDAQRQYDPWLDLNDDGKIDIRDIFLVAVHFGTSGTPIDKLQSFGWIGGHSGGMWNDFSIGLNPNRAVLSLESDRKFNVSVKGSYWAPFDFGPHPFYFKIYDSSTDYKGAITSDEPELLSEETVFANKSKDELNYVILANFTVLLDTGGTHIYTIVGGSWADVTLDSWECIATFALNIA